MLKIASKLSMSTICVWSVLLTASVYDSAFALSNLRLDPTGLIFGFSKLELDMPVSSNVSIGPRIGYFQNSKLGSYNETIFSIGITAIYSFAAKPFESGWYVAPNLSYQSLKISEDTGSYGRLNGTDTSFALELIAGYRWFWDGGFNIHLGLGPVFSSISSVDLRSADGLSRDNYSFIGTGVKLASDFSLGFVF